MVAADLIKLLTEAVPESDTWGKSREPYGFTELDEAVDVKSVLYCVTPTKEVVEAFKAGGYDLLISHHPFRVGGVPQAIFHTCLDCCNGGLNDMWKDALGIKNARHFDENIGWVGEIEPITMNSLLTKIEAFTGKPVLGQVFCKPELEHITSVVVCTGLGGLVNHSALATGAECYILGESCCRAEDSGFKAMVEVGHTNSEWIGVKLFKKLLEPYGVRVDGAEIGKDRFGGEVYRSRNFQQQKRDKN